MKPSKMQTSAKMKDFFSVFKIPGFIQPWIDRFFKDDEIDLVMQLAKKPLTRKEIYRIFSAGFKPGISDTDIDPVTRMYQKGIINRCDGNRFEPADFHTRFDKWAMFEGWKDVPDEIRQTLNDWELANHERTHADQIENLKSGQSRDPSLIYPEYVLLHEAEALLDRTMHIYLMPCNCRSMMQKCNQSVFTCLRFEDDRDIGWEISKSRAKAVVNRANKNGLMQSAEVGLAEDGALSGAICNCCADCCFPHTLAERRNAQKLWPLSRYVARHLKDRCIACGRCTRRCPFQAFTFQKHRRTSKKRTMAIDFNEDRCRGCGVCSTGCPEEAIDMVRVENDQSLINAFLRDDGFAM